MTDPTARDLIQRLLTVLGEDYAGTALVAEARAYLAAPEPEGPASVVYGPSDDEERFENWWYHEGSAPPRPEHDLEEHTHRTSKSAWLNGAYCARYGNHTPLSPSDRMPGTAPGDLDFLHRCWLWSAPADSLGVPAQWRLLRPMQSVHWDRWLPASVKHLPAEVE